MPPCLRILTRCGGIRVKDTANSLCHGHRPVVARVDKAVNAVNLHLQKAVIAHGHRGLDGDALSFLSVKQAPAEFQRGPSRRFPVSAYAQRRTALRICDGEGAISAHVPMADDGCKCTPRTAFILQRTTDKAAAVRHDEVAKSGVVIAGGWAQYQPFCFQYRPVDRGNTAHLCCLLMTIIAPFWCQALLPVFIL